MALNYEIQKGNKFCMDHLKDEITFMCTTCGIPLCNECIASNLHKGHEFESIKKHAQGKYTKLQDFKTKAQSKIVPDINQKVKSADRDFDEVEEIIEFRIENAKHQGTYLKELIDDQVSSTEAEFKDLLDTYRGQHTKYKFETGDSLETLVKLISECTEATRSDNDHLLIDVANYAASRNFSISTYEKPRVPNYIRGSEPLKHIQTAFGFIEKEKSLQYENVSESMRAEDLKADRQQSKHEEMSDIKAGELTKTGQSPDENKLVKPKKKPNKTKQPDTPTRMLMTTPEVTKKIKLENAQGPRLIVRTKDGTLVMCDGNVANATLTMIDLKGSMFLLNKFGLKEAITKLECDVEIYDIAVDPSTDKLYCIHYGRRDVRSLTMKGKTHKLFDLEDEVPPQSLAVTQHSSNIIIGDRNKPNIHIYTLAGIKLQSVQCVGTPSHITVCRSTGRIAVGCWDEGVMVLDDKYEELYTAEYHAYHAAFDRYGYLLVRDYFDLNKCIQVLNAATGEHIETISSDLIKGKVCCITTQNNDELAVCVEEDQNKEYKIQSIRYLR